MLASDAMVRCAQRFMPASLAPWRTRSGAAGVDLLDQLPQVTALVRGMALRAELADRAGDSTTAGRWANDVLTLWSDADQELQPTTTRMRRIAGVH